MNKKIYILYTFLLVLFFCSVNLNGQNSSVDSIFAKTMPDYGDTVNSNIVVSFKVINIDSLDELNFELIKHSGDTIFIIGKVIEKFNGGYKIEINNTIQFVGYQKGSLQRVNIYLPKSEKLKVSKMFFNTRKKWQKKHGKSFKIKSIKL